MYSLNCVNHMVHTQTLYVCVVVSSVRYLSWKDAQHNSARPIQTQYQAPTQKALKRSVSVRFL